MTEVEPTQRQKDIWNETREKNPKRAESKGRARKKHTEAYLGLMGIGEALLAKEVGKETDVETEASAGHAFVFGRDENLKAEKAAKEAGEQYDQDHPGVTE